MHKGQPRLRGEIRDLLRHRGEAEPGVSPACAGKSVVGYRRLEIEGGVSPACAGKSLNVCSVPVPSEPLTSPPPI